MLHHYQINSIDNQTARIKLLEKYALNGVRYLNPKLTINGTTVEPVFRYKGGDASASGWSPWGYGESLSANSVGGVTFNNGSPLLGTNDDSVLFDGTGYFSAGNADFADITTEDIVVELIIKATDGTLPTPFAKRDGANNGFRCYANSNKLHLLCEDADTNNALVQTGTLTVGAWYHIIFFINRDGTDANSSKSYVNGIEDCDIANAFSSVGSITVENNFCIGATSEGNNPYNSNIAYLALWKQSDWHQSGADGPAEWAEIAKERFIKLTGFWPQKGNLTPSYTRNTVAYLDKLDTTSLMQQAANLLSDGDMEHVSESAVTVADWNMEVNADSVVPLADGDMEAEGVDSWNAGNGCVLEKVPVSADGHGSQVLRVNFTTTSNQYASVLPGPLNTTRIYRISVKTRSDGTLIPQLSVSGTAANGTTSTDWQTITIVAKPNATWLTLRTSTDTTEGYCDFDNLEVTDITDSIASWASYNNAILSKETDSPYAGTQSLRVKTTLASSGNWSAAYPQPNVLTIGNTYRITGWARSANGVGIPAVWRGSFLWTGTTSTEWQEISAVVKTTAAAVYFAESTGTNGAEVEFDNIQITDITDSVSDWTAANDALLTKEDGTRTNGSGEKVLRVTYNGTNYPATRQTVTMAEGQKYRFSCWYRSDGVTTPRIGNIPTAEGLPISTEWAYYEIVFIHGSQSSPTVSPFLYAYTTTDGWVEFDDVKLEEIPARKLYKVGAGWPRLVSRLDNNNDIITGYLCEPAVENLTEYSEGFDNIYWTKGRTSVLTSSVVAPDGSANAFVIHEDATAANTHYINETQSYTSGTTYTRSVFLKANNRDRVAFTINDSAKSWTSYYDLTDGSIISLTAGAEASTELYGDGWYRCILTITAENTGAGTAPIFVASGSTTAFDGLNQDSVYIWGAQLEEGSTPTSYIPTEGSAETKNADVLYYTLSGTDVASPVNTEVTVADGDMEAIGVGEWTAVNDAVLSKESGSPSGSGSQVLRVAYGGTNAPMARISPLTIGRTYTVSFYARGDGSVSPLLTSGATRWTGTTSTDWQFATATWVANSTALNLYCSATTEGQYCEFDDIQITDITEEIQGEMTIDCAFVPSIDEFADYTSLYQIDAGNNNERSVITIDNSNKLAWYSKTAGNGSYFIRSEPGALDAGVVNRIQFIKSYTSNFADLRLNGSSVGTYTNSIDSPRGITSIRFGHYYGGSGAPNGGALFSNIKITRKE